MQTKLLTLAFTACLFAFTSAAPATRQDFIEALVAGLTRITPPGPVSNSFEAVTKPAKGITKSGFTAISRTPRVF